MIECIYHGWESKDNEPCPYCQIDLLKLFGNEPTKAVEIESKRQATLANERADLIDKDKQLLDDVIQSMDSYIWQTTAMGNSGEEEMSRVQEAARKAIKALVNYI